VAFNNVGHFTLAPGKSIRLDGWAFPGNADMGAQYFSADPIFRHPRLASDFMLITSDQSKMFVGTFPGGHVEYGFRVTHSNASSVLLASFSVQGGGFV
jgi:hypothetical protein